MPWGYKGILFWAIDFVSNSRVKIKVRFLKVQEKGQEKGHISTFFSKSREKTRLSSPPTGLEVLHRAAELFELKAHQAAVEGVMRHDPSTRDSRRVSVGSTKAKQGGGGVGGGRGVGGGGWGEGWGEVGRPWADHSAGHSPL